MKTEQSKAILDGKNKLNWEKLEKINYQDFKQQNNVTSKP